MKVWWGAQAIVTLALVLGVLRLQWSRPSGGLLGPPERPAQTQQMLAPLSVREAFAAYTEGTAWFIDGRSADQYREAHIPGAIPCALAEASLVKSLPARPLLVVCAEGPTAEQLALALRPHTSSSVQPLVGGMPAWVAAGHPTLP